ncbi:MAG: MerR family transcriptional regulator [Clostridia bacterium]|nr:MerR family transcriptional regulator [Clostridia bacterium]
MKLKELASATDISERTIRYYISDGVFVPEKYSESYTGRKSYDYTENDVKRLKQIALLRKYDFSIKDIKDFFDGKAEVAEVLKANIEKARRNEETQKDNIAVMENALLENPQTIDELCEALSNPIAEKMPIPNIDEQSAYKPMYKKTKKRNTLLIVIISVVSTLAAIFMLYFGWYFCIVGLQIPVDVEFNPKHVFCMPMEYYKDYSYYEDFIDTFKYKYNLTNSKAKELYDNAESYVELTVLGDVNNYHEYNIDNIHPKNALINGLDKNDFSVGWRKNSYYNYNYYYTYCYAGDTVENYSVKILMKKDVYDKLASENKLKPEDITINMVCASNKDPFFEKISAFETSSFFNSFEIIDGKVLFHCTVTLYNDSTQTQAVKIKGDFNEDYRAGLVKEQYLYACDENDYNINCFNILSGEEKTLNICFIGTAAGKTTEKQNRMLPKLSFEATAVESDTPAETHDDDSYDAVVTEICEHLYAVQKEYTPNISEKIAQMTNSKFIGDEGNMNRQVLVFEYDEHLWFRIYDVPFTSCTFYYDTEEYDYIYFEY